MTEWKLFIRDRIREARKLRQLTQAQLAEAIGVEDLTISKFERGRILPSVDTVERIAVATGRPLDWFFRSRGQTVTHPILSVDGESLRHSVRRLAEALALVSTALSQLEGMLPAELRSLPKGRQPGEKGTGGYSASSSPRVSLARERPLDADDTDD